MYFRHTLAILATLGFSVLTACGGPADDTATETPATAEAPAPEPTTVDAGYDPAADPIVDLAAAIEVTAQNGNRILLEVGSNSLVWCQRLAAFFEAHPDLREFRDQHYAVVKVNRSDENQNTEFLKGYPGIAGYPHIFVLDSDGSLLHSQDTTELESEDGYDPAKVREFLQIFTLRAL